MYSIWNLITSPFSSTTAPQERCYNCTPDTYDKRDQYHLFYSIYKLKPTIDLRSLCPPVYNQGKLGSCTANAIAGAYEFDEMKQHEVGEPFIPSRLFIYYNERSKENQIEHDAGAEIRDGIKSIVKQGVCPESDWPYIISKFTEKPPEKCYEIAQQHKAVKYRRVLQMEEQFKRCLSDGYPIVLGVAIFSSFESPEVARTGQVPMPQQDEEHLGGHAVLCVGYDDENKVFIVRNSWGTEWGDQGYFYLPYEYMLHPDLATDFWTVIQVRDGPQIPTPPPLPEKPLINLNDEEFPPIPQNIVPVFPEVPLVPELPQAPETPEPLEID